MTQTVNQAAQPAAVHAEIVKIRAELSQLISRIDQVELAEDDRAVAAAAAHLDIPLADRFASRLSVRMGETGGNLRKALEVLDSGLFTAARLVDVCEEAKRGRV